MQTGKGRRTRSKAALKRLGAVHYEATEAKDYVAQLRAESDRGAIVLIATYIEEGLTVRLREVLLRNDQSLEEKLFGTSGIIGTFSAKINMMAAIGLISPSVAALIDHIRLVRNAAAHMTADITFDAVEMKDALLALVDDDSQTMMEDAPRKDWRDAFVLSCMVLHQVVTDRHDAPNIDRVVELIISEARSGIEQTGALPLSKLYTRTRDQHEAR